MNYITKKVTLKDSGITWIREIPKHWNVGILNNLVQIIVSNVDKKNYEAEIKVLLCNYRDVYYNRFITSKIDFMEASATKSEVEKFSLEINDLLITKDSETPDDIAVPSLVSEKIPNLLCGYHLSILRPLMDKLDGKYLLFSIISTSIKSQFSSLATGITRYGLSYKHIKNINICVPPLQEQKAIASFLDDKTAAIATLIAKKQHLIQLLEEKRTALINQTVTKGLNPNAPMKDSGIPWIGEIPEHWLRTSIKRVCSSVRDGTHNPPPRAEGEYRLLSARNIQNGKFILRDDDRLMDADAFAELERSYTVRKDDVVIAVVGATTGKSAVVGTLERVSVQRSVAILRPKKSVISSKYLNFWISSGGIQHEIALTSSKYSDQGGIYLDDLANLTSILPPSKEQIKILNFLDKAFAPILITEQKLSEQIEKLQEYRQSLITAAVTGKINIGEDVTA